MKRGTGFTDRARARGARMATSATAVLLALGLASSQLAAQLSLPADFSRTLSGRGVVLDSERLAGYRVVPVVANPDMEYDIGLRSPSGRLEVRYAFRDEPGGESMSQALVLATLLNVGTGQDRLGPFPQQAVRAEFGADVGVSGPFVPRAGFSSEHDAGIMVAIWAEGRGAAYAFYLFNESEREAALDEWRSVFYALQFRR